jgi:hypothetical protein
MSALLGICLAWLVALNGAAINLEHVSSVKPAKVYSTVTGQYVYYARATMDFSQSTSNVPATYDLARFDSEAEAREWISDFAGEKP